MIYLLGMLLSFHIYKKGSQKEAYAIAIERITARLGVFALAFFLLLLPFRAAYSAQHAGAQAVASSCTDNGQAVYDREYSKSLVESIGKALIVLLIL